MPASQGSHEHREGNQHGLCGRAGTQQERSDFSVLEDVAVQS